ncbi:MAG: patatin-like phospholipase family protein, partial [Xanthomonas perforans]|nr:patatin-like phospholipase family protein [Xanthomonas perforans]
PAPVVQAPSAGAPKPVKIGVALGGGAAKGFAHIGVIKMLEANGFAPVVVSGTSAGSVVGALYASGMDAFQMQEKAVALDQTSIRDVRIFSGGLVQGQKLQDYVNEQLGGKPIDKLRKPFAAVATRLEDGERTVFVRGNAGQAVRASSSIPGVFEPVTIGQYHYVDGGVVSPVPVDAARQLGAEFVVAVDISSKASGKNPGDLLGTVNQSISIMGQRLGEAELKRADVVIRPKVNDIGSADFNQRGAAILEGERAAM